MTNIPVMCMAEAAGQDQTPERRASPSTPKALLPELKDGGTHRFSHFVFQVSLTEGAIIYDVALESLINCLALLMCSR